MIQSSNFYRFIILKKEFNNSKKSENQKELKNKLLLITNFKRHFNLTWL